MPRMTPPTKKNFDKRRAKIYQLYEQGITLTDIGKVIGIGREAVRLQVKRYQHLNDINT